MIQEEKIRDFIIPFYTKKDMMHDMSHVARLLKKARNMAKIHQVNDFVLTAATYFQGMEDSHIDAIEAFLDAHGVDVNTQKHIIQVKQESYRHAVPVSIEGKILHDAHLLEGGEAFGIIKPLIAGALKGKSLEESIDHYEKYLQGQFKCALPENYEELQNREAFAFLIIEKLAKEL